jgi:hypothetical protein
MEDVKSMTVPQLKAELSLRGLKMTGNKADLISRLESGRTSLALDPDAKAKPKRPLPEGGASAPQVKKPKVKSNPVFVMPEPIHASETDGTILKTIPAWTAASDHGSRATAQWMLVTDRFPDFPNPEAFDIVYQIIPNDLENYFDHVFLLRPKRDVIVQLMKHDTLFNYPLDGIFEVTPACPICRAHAECFNEDSNPLFMDIFEGMEDLGKENSTGEFNPEDLGISMVCQNGHITMMYPECRGEIE